MRDAVEPSAAFIVRIDDEPRSNVSIGCRHHFIAGSRVVVPTTMRLEIHRTEFPDFTSVVNPRQKPAGLLVLTNLEPVFDENYPRMNKRFLSRRSVRQEILGRVFGAEAH